MNSFPKFSIIVPIYKAETFIDKCIEGIITQTITDFELLLIDDGSPDRCGVICEEYAQKDSRIKVFHKKNGGASSARNLGLDKAIGEIICFVDSDDCIARDFLENFGDCHADITVQGLYARRPNEEHEQYIPIEEGSYNTEKIHSIMDNLYKSQNTGYLVTRAFKRQIIEDNKLRLNERYRVREDEEFIWRYMCKCKTFVTVNRGAYHYEMPDFSSKYSFIDIDSDFECTTSIIENIASLLGNYNHPHVVNGINRLAHLILRYYKDKNFDYSTINKYLTDFCELYEKVKVSISLNKKTKILYYLVGTHTPNFIHRIYNIILSN